MAVSRKAISDWFWDGGPERRLLVSLAVTVVVLAPTFFAGSAPSKSLLLLFLGWDFGAWFLDKMYVERLTRHRGTLGAE